MKARQIIATVLAAMQVETTRTDYVNAGNTLALISKTIDLVNQMPDDVNIEMNVVVTPDGNDEA